mgnify:CR=1 FL=1
MQMRFLMRKFLVKIRKKLWKVKENPKLGDANAENEAEKIVLSVEDYNVTFDREIMEHVSFVLHAGDKVAIVGPNGTGKTTLLRDVIKGENPAIRLGENVKMAYLSQMHGRY